MNKEKINLYIFWELPKDDYGIVIVPAINPEEAKDKIVDDYDHINKANLPEPEYYDLDDGPIYYNPYQV